MVESLWCTRLLRHVLEWAVGGGILVEKVQVYPYENACTDDLTRPHKTHSECIAGCTRIPEPGFMPFMALLCSMYPLVNQSHSRMDIPVSNNTPYLVSSSWMHNGEFWGPKRWKIEGTVGCPIWTFWTRMTHYGCVRIRMAIE